MSEISRVALFGKLNSLGYRAIESATVFCKMRGNPYVELVHWLHQLLQQQDSDLHRIIKHFNLDASRLAKDVVEALDRLPRGFGGMPSCVASSGSAIVHSIASIIEKSTRATAPVRRRHSAAAAMNASISPHIGSSQAKPTLGAISGWRLSPANPA